jgi:hypothetical protein
MGGADRYYKGLNMNILVLAKAKTLKEPENTKDPVMASRYLKWSPHINTQYPTL